MVLSVLRIMCLMNKYKGYIYLVHYHGADYAVKFNHLDEFVALHHGNGAIVVNDFVMSQIVFDNEFQWYKIL